MRFLLFVFLLLCCSSGFADETFERYLDGLILEASEAGISQVIIDKVRPTIKYRPSVVKADKNQPEKKITLDTYLATRVPDWKVSQALEKMQVHHELLTKISSEYGVPARFIVALWGNESNFGRIQGKHPVVSSLASLAFEGRREALFKRQFIAALTILQQGHVSADKFLGSWAGAMGQSQFMPATFLDFAVDYDQDGKKDIWNTPADVFASIANFLARHGWDGDYTWGRQVKLTQPISSKDVGLKQTQAKPLSVWSNYGITRFNGEALPNAAIDSWLIMPDGTEGRIYLVYNNFQTLMRWNRSSYFGISVSYLAERIKKGV
ncbi:lytic murein transglycosylase [Alteromonas sediminis]|uniref:Lytic murein transglycosylase n=1 Tax=Alteromonas sediminis TaxID=2259342 RepID=A0A3N5XWL6_9ALTE|nr:lytic murein transglycosylase [Alteromonas sediminis]RPJ65082.1 lytic murein transglycosylase [Alteromonas sediminis]